MDKFTKIETTTENVDNANDGKSQVTEQSRNTDARLPISQTKVPNDNTNANSNLINEHLQREAYIERMNFEQKIKALLNDFGLG